MRDSGLTALAKLSPLREEAPMSINRASLIVLSSLLAACGTTALSPEAKSVTVVRASDRPLHCKVLGPITGSSRGSDEKQAKAGAENDFRNQAAELKANFAVIETENGGPAGTTSDRKAFLGGKALHCQTEAMEEAEEKAAAAAQEKKEKEEADREREEQDDKEAEAEKKKAQKD